MIQHILFQLQINFYAIFIRKTELKHGVSGYCFFPYALYILSQRITEQCR